MGRAIQDRIDIATNFDMSYDLVNSLLGDFVGEGTRRIVFDYNLMPGYVIKIEKDIKNTDNLMEFEFFSFVVHQPEVVKWIPHCIWISDNGRFLVQKKVKPITKHNKKNIPEMVPAFLTDMKFDNYGFIGKQFVCMDYAFSAGICSSAALNGKMHKFKSHLNEK